ncbi:hypothetical protein ACVITL_001816 [Rhizobium pisi]
MLCSIRVAFQRPFCLVASEYIDRSAVLLSLVLQRNLLIGKPKSASISTNVSATWT